MNIGIFTDTYYPQINGVATSVMMLDKELTKLGHKVYIFTTSDPKATRSNPKVFRLPSMPFVFLPSNRFALLYPPRLLMKMKRFKLDIIHTQTEFPLGIFGKIVSEFYRIPLVHTYHTMYEDYVHYIARGRIVSPKMAQRYSRIFCNRAKAVITPVQKSKDKLASYGVIRPIYVIPTGIDFTPFSRDAYSQEDINAIKRELGIAPGAPVLVSVGRLAKEKSVDVIVRQIPKVLEQIPDLKFVVVGDGPYKEKLMEMVAELRIRDAVIFTGSRPWSEIGKYYQLGDAFVCASTSETQGLTYIESMAAKTPVIAKRDPSIEGIVRHGITGFCFDDDVDAAEAICAAMSDKAEMQRIAENAYASIQFLSSENFGKNLETCYREIIAQPDTGQKPRKKQPQSKNLSRTQMPQMMWIRGMSQKLKPPKK